MNGCGSILDAVLRNDVGAIIRKFKENPKDINVSLSDGRTPLILAIERRQQDVLLKLLQLGASVSLPYQDVQTNPWHEDLTRNVSVYPLQVACDVDWNWAVVQLIKRHAHPSHCREGYRGLLRKAVTWGDRELVKKLVNMYCSQNQSVVSNRELAGLITLAVRKEDVAMVTLLVQLGFDVNMVDNDIVPLMVAAEMENVVMCEVLIKHGADIARCHKSSLKPNALAMAVKAGWIKAVNTLIAVGMGLCSNLTMDNCVYDKGLLSNGSTVLHLAVAKGHHGIIQTLVQAGAPVDARDYVGDTPLHVACKDSVQDTQIVEYLLSTAHYYLDERHGIVPSKRNSCHGNWDRTDCRLATVNAQNLQGLTALMLCCKAGHVDMIDVLLRYGADLELEDHEHKTALHHAVVAKHDAIAEHLLKNGAKVDPRSCQHITPLHLSAMNGDYTVAELLLEYGAEVNNTTRNNETVLYLATQAKCEEQVELFIERGCDVNACTTAGETALMLACRRNAASLCRRLIRAGALLDLQNFSQMETGLSMAAYFGCVPSACVMICEGADLDKPDKGKTCPVYWCIYNSREDILRLLVTAGVTLTPADFAKYPRHLSLMRKTALVEWIESTISSPRTLFDLCRRTIREELRVRAKGRGIGVFVERLPLPKRTREQLLFEHEIMSDNEDSSLSSGEEGDQSCYHDSYDVFGF